MLSAWKISNSWPQHSRFQFRDDDVVKQAKENASWKIQRKIKLSGKILFIKFSDYSCFTFNKACFTVYADKILAHLLLHPKVSQKNDKKLATCVRKQCDIETQQKIGFLDCIWIFILAKLNFNKFHTWLDPHRNQNFLYQKKRYPMMEKKVKV